MEDNHDQPTKQPNYPQRVPLTRRHQVESDFVLATALQGQERAFTALETIESDQDNESSTSANNAASSSNESNYDYNQEDYEFFLDASGFEAELAYLDDEENDEDMEENDDDDDDDDELDVDELTYEELIALGEFIGVEERGLSLNEISSCLNPIVCKINHQAKTAISNIIGVDRCVICQIEFEDGESLVALPCEHPYHSDCISKWLRIKKSCPICSIEVSSPFSKHDYNNVNHSST